VRNFREYKLMPAASNRTRASTRIWIAALSCLLFLPAPLLAALAALRPAWLQALVYGAPLAAWLVVLLLLLFVLLTWISLSMIGGNVPSQDDAP